MFPTREILQPRPDTSYACWNCCFLPVRACSPTRIPRRHVRSDILTREILQPHCNSSYACLNCCSLSVRSWSPSLIWFAEPVRPCSPVLILRKYVRSPVLNLWDPAAPTWHVLQPRPDTSYACWNRCSKPVRSCSPVLIPRKHVRFGVPNPWDPAVPSCYFVGVFELVSRTRESLQPGPDIS